MASQPKITDLAIGQKTTHGAEVVLDITTLPGGRSEPLTLDALHRVKYIGLRGADLYLDDRHLCCGTYESSRDIFYQLTALHPTAIILSTETVPMIQIFMKEIPFEFSRYSDDRNETYLGGAGVTLFNGNHYLTDRIAFLTHFYNDKEVLFGLVRDIGAATTLTIINGAMDEAIRGITRIGYTIKQGGTAYHYDYHHARIALKMLGVYRDRDATYHENEVEARARRFFASKKRTV